MPELQRPGVFIPQPTIDPVRPVSYDSVVSTLRSWQESSQARALEAAESKAKEIGAQAAQAASELPQFDTSSRVGRAAQASARSLWMSKTQVASKTTFAELRREWDLGDRGRFKWDVGAFQSALRENTEKLLVGTDPVTRSLLGPELALDREETLGYAQGSFQKRLTDLGTASALDAIELTRKAVMGDAAAADGPEVERRLGLLVTQFSDGVDAQYWTAEWAQGQIEKIKRSGRVELEAQTILQTPLEEGGSGAAYLKYFTRERYPDGTRIPADVKAEVLTRVQAVWGDLEAAFDLGRKRDKRVQEETREAYNRLGRLALMGRDSEGLPLLTDGVISSWLEAGYIEGSDADTMRSLVLQERKRMVEGDVDNGQMVIGWESRINWGMPPEDREIEEAYLRRDLTLGTARAFLDKASKARDITTRPGYSQASSYLANLYLGSEGQTLLEAMGSDPVRAAMAFNGMVKGANPNASRLAAAMQTLYRRMQEDPTQDPMSVASDIGSRGAPEIRSYYETVIRSNLPARFRNLEPEEVLIRQSEVEVELIRERPEAAQTFTLFHDAVEGLRRLPTKGER